MTPEQRAQRSARMKAAMASPEVRQRVSEGTRASMAPASGRVAELYLLKTAWAAARPGVRQEFLLSIVATDGGSRKAP